MQESGIIYMNKISAVIPAYNEEKYLGKTIEALKEIGEIKEIIVVNDGSTDGTKRIALDHGAKLIDLNENRGKGGAVQEGIKHAGLEVIALVDADLGSSAGEIKKLVESFYYEKTDMVIAGFRGEAAGGGFGLARRMAALIIKTMTGHSIRYPLSGQRVIKKEVLEGMGEFPGGFGLEFGLTLSALNNGYSIEEVDTDMSHRLHGKDVKGFIHRGRQLLAITSTFFDMLKREKRVS